MCKTEFILLSGCRPEFRQSAIWTPPELAEWTPAVRDCCFPSVAAVVGVAVVAGTGPGWRSAGSRIAAPWATVGPDSRAAAGSRRASPAGWRVPRDPTPSPVCATWLSCSGTRPALWPRSSPVAWPTPLWWTRPGTASSRTTSPADAVERWWRWCGSCGSCADASPDPPADPLRDASWCPLKDANTIVCGERLKWAWVRLLRTVHRFLLRGGGNVIAEQMVDAVDALAFRHRHRLWTGSSTNRYTHTHTHKTRTGTRDRHCATVEVNAIRYDMRCRNERFEDDWEIEGRRSFFWSVTGPHPLQPIAVGGRPSRLPPFASDYTAFSLRVSVQFESIQFD